MNEPLDMKHDPREPGPCRAPGCLVLVDDEPDDRRLVEMALQAEADLREMPVLHVRDAADLDRVLQEGRAALVVTDHRLCWGNGLEVLERFRSRDPTVPVIFYTATGNEEVAVAALKGGARDYLTKTPRHLLRLVRVIRQALQERRSREQFRDLEGRWSRLFADVPVGLYRTTWDGQVLQFNQTLRTLLGLDPAAPPPPASEVYLNPADRRRLLDSLRADGVVRDFLVPLRGPGGTPRWCSLNARLVQDPEHGAVVEGAMVDVTDRLENERRFREVLETTIETLALALEKRDPYTAGHSRRVARLGRSIAEALGLDEEVQHGLFLGGLLHDIGKIAVPAEILARPSRLTVAEFQIVQSHCEVGAEILQGCAFPWPIDDMVRHHHERLDGSGYPDRLRGDEVSRWARILAVADVAEAMASHRPYRPALGIPATIDELRARRGVLYDADAADACIEVLQSRGLTD